MRIATRGKLFLSLGNTHGGTTIPLLTVAMMAHVVFTRRRRSSGTPTILIDRVIVLLIALAVVTKALP